MGVSKQLFSNTGAQPLSRRTFSVAQAASMRLLTRSSCTSSATLAPAAVAAPLTLLRAAAHVRLQAQHVSLHGWAELK